MEQAQARALLAQEGAEGRRVGGLCRRFVGHQRKPWRQAVWEMRHLRGGKRGRLSGSGSGS